jgi:hypothetical protein
MKNGKIYWNNREILYLTHYDDVQQYSQILSIKYSVPFSLIHSPILDENIKKQYASDMELQLQKRLIGRILYTNVPTREFGTVYEVKVEDTKNLYDLFTDKLPIIIYVRIRIAHEGYSLKPVINLNDIKYDILGFREFLNKQLNWN